MHAPYNTIEHAHVKILVSALECQVSQGEKFLIINVT